MLLAHIARWDEQRWVDEVAHWFMPIVMVVDRVLAPVVLGVSGRLNACWPVHPLGCGAATLIRGPIVDWYPYLFTISASGGWVSTVIGPVVPVIGFALFALR